MPFAASEVKKVNVVSARKLSHGDGIKSVIELTLDNKDLFFNYLPGDTVGVLPKNPEEEVSKVFERLQLDSNEFQNYLYKIEIDENTKKRKPVIPTHIPIVTSIKYLLENCLDLRAVLKKSFIRALVECTEDHKEQRRLRELCCHEGFSEYNEQILGNNSSILDIFTSFPSCHPSLSLLLEHLPRLQPRVYSIASSPLEQGSLRLVFSLVMDSRGRRGVCSGWLYDITRQFHDINYKLKNLWLSNNTNDRCQISVYLRMPTRFRIPVDPDVPLIMIGPGTGIAPFIGFMEHRYKQYKDQKRKKPKNWLFYGCRHKNKDDIYGKEISVFQEEDLCQYFVCYSRDGHHPKYVQELIMNKKWEFVKHMFSEKTYTFICGDSLNMDKDVTKAIKDSIQIVEGVEESTANKMLRALEEEGRLLRDVWC